MPAATPRFTDEKGRLIPQDQRRSCEDRRLSITRSACVVYTLPNSLVVVECGADVIGVEPSPVCRGVSQPLRRVYEASYDKFNGQSFHEPLSVAFSSPVSGSIRS
jgi:hypothetical protein